MTIRSDERRGDAWDERGDLCLVGSVDSCCRTAASLIRPSDARKGDRASSLVKSSGSATASDVIRAPSLPGGEFKGGVTKGNGTRSLRLSGGGDSASSRRQARS
jgi:hypothetical protein